MQVQLSVCTRADLDELVDMLSVAFATHDPPAVAVGLTVQEFADLVDLYRDRAAGGGCTMIARASTGEMVGALLAEDSAAPFPHGLERLSPKFDPIFEILTDLEAEYRRGRCVLPGDAIHLFLLGVNQAFGRQQIAQRLVAGCIELAIARGYRLAVTEATNNVSRYIFQKLGFVERARRAYADYRFGSQAVFAAIASHGGPVLLDREIG
jgi:ribosomal protein S18 acetylase RimI-like enzyme